MRLVRMFRGSVPDWSSCTVTNSTNQSSMNTSSRRFLYRHIEFQTPSGRMKTITLKNLFAVTMAMALVAATSTVSTALAQSNYEPYSFATLAGIPPGSGGLGGDGTGSYARFISPSGVAVDSAGNVYVADT